jgi:hypothetical protein
MAAKSAGLQIAPEEAKEEIAIPKSKPRRNPKVNFTVSPPDV